MVDLFTSKRFYLVGWIASILLLVIGVPIAVFVSSPGGIPWGLVIRIVLISVFVGGWFFWSYRKECSKEVLRQTLGPAMEVEIEDVPKEDLPRIRVIQRDLLEELREEGFKKYSLYIAEKGREVIMNLDGSRLIDGRKQRILKVVNENPGMSVRKVIDKSNPSFWKSVTNQGEFANVYDVAELVSAGLLIKETVQEDKAT